MNQKHASPRLKSSVKDFSSFLEENCPVKKNLAPKEAEGDIFKDNGTRAAILVSNVVNVTLLTNVQTDKCATCSEPAGGNIPLSSAIAVSDAFLFLKPHFKTINNHSTHTQRYDNIIISELVIKQIVEIVRK